MLSRVIFLAILALGLVSCSKGVDVPATFPLRISLPAGSEIQDDGSTAADDSTVHTVFFSCSAPRASVQKHIASQLKGLGFNEWSLPGMEDAPEGMGMMFRKEGGQQMVSLTAEPGGNDYLLMVMEMPDLGGFRP